MIDFFIYSDPVLAVTCPDCGKADGIKCAWPDGSNSSDFHKSRKELADQIFVTQHGNYVRLEKVGERWIIVPTSRRCYYQWDAQLPLL